MLTLLFFSFLAGFITILAPCIWPLLPIVFSASSAGGNRRPLGLTLGVMISFTFFTLTISYLVKIFPINPNSLRLLATIIIAFLGFMLLIPSWGAAFESLISRTLSPFQSQIKREGSGFSAGLLTGLSLGLVWAPCAGPILATIAVLSATQAVNFAVVVITLAYVFGLGIPLFIFSFLSATWFKKMRQVNQYTGRIQQVFGFIMIVTAVLIYTNYDKAIQVKVLNVFPGYSRFLSQFENNASLQKELNKLTGSKQEASVENPTGKLPDFGAAPDSIGITTWLNTANSFSIKDLKGKIVLVDFWTYSCINCVRTLPHLTAWYERYKNAGLVIVGIHTPEFAFEKETNNVQNALKQFYIDYPVGLDNDYKTWRNYDNHYWPAEYLIDGQGHIRRRHFGEGEYDQMELAIRELLEENGKKVQGALSSVTDQTPDHARTPETYLGQARMERFSSPEHVKGGVQNFSKPSDILTDHFAYEGTWNVTAESAKSVDKAALEIKFKASKVFLVIGPANAEDKIEVFIDGNPIQNDQAGKDVKDGVILLDTERLYNIIDLKNKIETHTLRLEFFNEETAVYAFTFG